MMVLAGLLLLKNNYAPINLASVIPKDNKIDSNRHSRKEELREFEQLKTIMIA